MLSDSDSPLIQTQQGKRADQTELLQSRYELVYLVFQFLISLAVLIGVFLLIVVFQQGTVASGGIALSTLVVSYWLGLSVSRRL